MKNISLSFIVIGLTLISQAAYSECTATAYKDGYEAAIRTQEKQLSSIKTEIRFYSEETQLRIDARNGCVNPEVRIDRLVTPNGYIIYNNMRIANQGKLCKFRKGAMLEYLAADLAGSADPATFSVNELEKQWEDLLVGKITEIRYEIQPAARTFFVLDPAKHQFPGPVREMQYGNRVAYEVKINRKDEGKKIEVDAQIALDRETCFPIFQRGKFIQKGRRYGFGFTATINFNINFQLINPITNPGRTFVVPANGYGHIHIDTLFKDDSHTVHIEFTTTEVY